MNDGHALINNQIKSSRSGRILFFIIGGIGTLLDSQNLGFLSVNQHNNTHLPFSDSIQILASFDFFEVIPHKIALRDVLQYF